MKLGIIGRGPWGDVYAKTLKGLGIAFWQAGRGWADQPRADGVIVACAPDAHMQLAYRFIAHGIPVLIEKPISLRSDEARALLGLANRTDAIVYAGHTRLYSPAWREFREQVLEEGVRSVYAVAGGPSKLNHWWDWGPHLVAMCLDLGFDPAEATFVTTGAELPLHFDVNGGMCFGDVPTMPTPLEVLISEFVEAIELGEADYGDLELGVKVVEHLEAAAGLHRAKATPA